MGHEVAGCLIYYAEQEILNVVMIPPPQAAAQTPPSVFNLSCSH